MKKIPGIENYLATEDGKIYSMFRKRFLVQFERDAAKNLAVNIVIGSKNKKSVFKTKAVAPLICSAFYGEKPKGLVCAHLDGNNQNNHFGNLKWVTQKENIHHKYAHGTMSCGEKTSKSKLKNKDVFWIRENYGKLSIAEMARTLCVSEFCVSSAAKRKTWRHI